MLRGMELSGFRARFIDLLVENEVIGFGEFTLKSGRKSPYFINSGQLRTGRALGGLGRAYADCILDAGLAVDVVFGPAYKGIPLAVATAMALAERPGVGARDVGFTFDRKEAKDHGEGGLFVGTQPRDGQRVVIVDDVITSGASIGHSIELLRKTADVEISGVVVAVDRQERGRKIGTLQELQAEFGAPVVPVVNVRQIIDYLSGRRGLLSPAHRAAVEDYLDRYGAPDSPA
jgi:orotate phosphoribosyltransferase